MHCGITSFFISRLLKARSCHIRQRLWTIFPPRLFSTSVVRLISSISDEDEINDDVEDQEINQLLESYDKSAKRLFTAQQIFVVQPKIKWGPHKNKNTTAELMLAESVALTETLPNWKVCGTSINNVEFNTKKKRVFTSGVLENLTAAINTHPAATGVFINVDILTKVQHTELFLCWRLPIYDRYQIVLLIFKSYAKSKVTKLQVALAEIPYATEVFKELLMRAVPDTLDVLGSLGGVSRKDKQEMRDLVTHRKVALERGLRKIRSKRQLRREQVYKEHIPIVAVIGYTNSGKTSLIKCLTGDKNLVPIDRLFATLDVSLHAGVLPSSNMKTYFADTVGFISNIPTALIASFEATLEDIRFASLLVHIRDISHPDAVSQKIDVLQTLEKLELPKSLTESMIEVCNKVDRVKNTSSLEPFPANSFYISCVTKQGIRELQDRVEQTLKMAENYVTLSLKVPNGGEQLRFLQEHAGIASYEPTDDGNDLIVKATLKDIRLKQFLKYYGNLIHRPI